MTAWRITVQVYAPSYPRLREYARSIFDMILNAKSPNNITRKGGSGGGSIVECGYSVELVTPVRERIAELRREADRLEAECDSASVQATSTESPA